MSKINKIENESILNVAFNQDNSCFSIGTELGFKIYQTYPLKGPYERKMKGGIGIVEMLYKSNFLALIGGGKSPKFSNNKVVIWDDYEKKVISEIKFKTPIINIKLKKDLLFIICKRKIYIFDFNTYEIIEIISTFDNQKGLFAINNSPDFTVYAYPSKKDLKNITIACLNPKKNIAIKDHDDNVSFMAINYDGTLLATSDEKGILIKIYSCNYGDLIKKFKRGSSKVDDIYICFDNKTKFMAVTSNKGTIHVFSMGSTIKNLKELEKLKVEKEKKNLEKKDIKDEKLSLKEKDDEKDENKLTSKEENEEIIDNKKENEKEEKNNIKEDEINKNTINKINEEVDNKNEDNLPQNLKTYFGFSSTEKSFAKYKIGPQRNICSFVDNNLLVIVSFDNKYYLVEIDLEKGGYCTKKSEKNLIDNTLIK